MRAAVAAALVLALAFAVAAPHVHAEPAHDDCAVCVLRGAAPPPPGAPDVAPTAFTAAAVVGAPVLPPVSGAPLGAIPGQSPPAA